MGTKYSDLVTNNRAAPIVKNNVHDDGGKVHDVFDTFELATTDLDANDLVVIARVPSNAKVRDIRIINDDLDTNGTPTIVFRCGLYDTAGTAEDDDIYSPAGQTTLQAATTTWTTIFKKDASLIDKFVWEDAGLTADDGKFHDIVLKFNTGAATAAAGTLAVWIQYSLT